MFFFKKRHYKYKDVECIEYRKDEEQGLNGKYQCTRFSIIANQEVVGYIDFRDSDDPWLYWGGHIGYHIYEPFRGHHYAYQACMAIVPYILNRNHNSIYISASPENIASIKTIEKLNAKLISCETVPANHWCALQNEHIKSIFLWNLR